MNFSRRRFVALSAGGLAAARLEHTAWAQHASAETGPLETFVPYRQISSGPLYHWFGYYDKREFDPTGQLVLSNEVDFEGRSPTADDSIGVGYVDTRRDNRWVPLGRSKAWGWQQGCMLQWVGPTGQSVLWNDREGDRFVCRIHSLREGTTRTIDRPIYTISADGTVGLSVDFARINNLRPGYGYAGVPDSNVDQRAPTDSGIWRVDLQTGHSQLIVSLADVVQIPWPDGQRHEQAWHYFNHLLINPAGDRFIFLHRYRPGFDPRTLQYQGGFVTRMFTADMDGGRRFVLDPSGYTSHFIWKNDQEVCMWTRPRGHGDGFYVMRDQTDEFYQVGAEAMPVNGHNTYLPQPYNEWILNDTYPDSKTRRQTLYLYHPPSQRKIVLGHIPSPLEYRGEWRCDLHPRSSPEGHTVAIDSPHNGGRQLHLLDIESIVKAT